MLDPTKCTIVRSPVIVNNKIIWTATMTFHVKEEVNADSVNLRDFAAMENLDQQIKDRLHKLIWKAIYGDLLAPVMQLVVHARNFAPPNYQLAVLKNSALIVQLLKIKLVEPTKGAGGHVAHDPDLPPAPHLPASNPSENRP